MSATGRGAVRRESDFYPTPAWAVRRLLEALKLPGGLWLEPGAGEGAIVRAVHAVRSDVMWSLSEIRSEAQPALHRLPWSVVADLHMTDFLETGTPEEWAGRDFAVALGNPPFRLAQAFVDRALELAEHVVFLLRINFLGSIERQAWWQTHPADLYVLPNRPDFTGDGGDSCEYGWFHWTRGRTKPGRICVLGLTGRTEMLEDMGQLPLALVAP